MLLKRIREAFIFNFLAFGEMKQHVTKIGNRALFQMTRPGCAFVAGFHQRGEVFLTYAANVELVDSGGKFFRYL